jgi:CMP-N,N'-diacetyllegionaminic acid synthase
MSLIVTVCARGGSKGVLGKNVRVIAGIPLISHTLRQAKAAKVFDAFAVSSDSPEILAIARQEGFLAIERSAEMSSDTAAKVPVIRDCVCKAEKITKTKYDYCVDLDCTSPLRTVEDILNVIDLIKQDGVSNIITGMPARRSPYFNLVEISPDGAVQLAKKLDSPVYRRQDAPKCFDMNASIYAWKRDVLRNESSLFLKGTKLYIMPEERSVDIDSELDFEIVKLLLDKRGGNVI